MKSEKKHGNEGGRRTSGREKRRAYPLDRPGREGGEKPYNGGDSTEGPKKGGRTVMSKKAIRQSNSPQKRRNLKGDDE